MREANFGFGFVVVVVEQGLVWVIHPLSGQSRTYRAMAAKLYTLEVGSLLIGSFNSAKSNAD